MGIPHLTIHHPLDHLTEYRINAPNKSSSRQSFLLFLAGSVVGSIGWSLRVWPTDTYDLLALYQQQTLPPTSLVVSLSVVFTLIYITLTHRSLVSESVIPIPRLGILLTSRSFSLLAFTPAENERLFIPMEDVESVVINEALSRFSVIGFLEILRNKGKEHVVVFPTLLPRTELLIPIYRDLQAALSPMS